VPAPNGLNSGFSRWKILSKKEQFVQKPWSFVTVV